MAVERFRYAFAKVRSFDPEFRFATGCCAGILVGWVLNELATRKGVTQEAAALVGAAVGAGITAFAALCIAKSETRDKRREYELFVGQAAAAMRDEAYVLRSVLGEQRWKNHRSQGQIMLKQMQNLEEALGLFREDAPTSSISNFRARVTIRRLQKQISNHLLEMLNNEKDWLEDRVTVARVDIR
ncbi:MAG: hypothetical protein ACM31O_21295 [Bacteroidota bacterium]